MEIKFVENRYSCVTHISLLLVIYIVMTLKLELISRLPFICFCTLFFCLTSYLYVSFKKASENGQEISQSHIADQPTAPRGRATQHCQAQDIRKTIN